MSVNLMKGQKVSLTKGDPSLQKIVVGLGWDVNAYNTGVDFDLGQRGNVCAQRCANSI